MRKDFMAKVPYASAIGSLMYAMTCTRPNISQVVGVVSRYMSNPGKPHWEAMKWILRYLRGTTERCLTFRRDELKLEGYVDSDFAGEKIVTISTNEAEYVAVTESSKELIWLQGLLAELGFDQVMNVLHSDSQSAIHLAKNSAFHSKTKHIDLRYHFIRSLIEEGVLKLVKIAGSKNPADMLTKPVTTEKLEMCAASVDPLIFHQQFHNFQLKKDMDITNWHSELDYEQWVALPVSGPRPSARYKHASAVVGEKVYIVGGSRNGRYLSDVQVFDLRSLAWSNVRLETELNAGEAEDSGSQEVLPPTSDHSMIKWGNKLFLLGGHSKKSSDSMIVWFIDLETSHCGVVKTSGKAPVARGGHSVSLAGSRLIVFGGEDRSRKLLNDVHVLDLETMTWDVIEAMQTSPAPRYDHTAAVHAERYLLVFGGCSHSIFFNDLHVLDLQTNEWSQPQIQGDLVSARAGHAGIAIDGNWYIVGGGDNNNGCPETIVLHMSKLVWSVLTSVKERTPLASEGLSVCSASIDGEKYMVAFGGYNGKYNNEVFVMRLKPKDISRPKIFQSPAAAAAAASVTAAYALAKSEKLDFPKNFNLNFGSSLAEEDVKIKIDALKEEKRVLELSLAETTTENSRQREKIDDVNSTHAELSKELHSVQGQLVSERSRCFKLEAQIAELHKMLESLQTIENEVQILRRQKSAMEQEMEHATAIKKQGSGGVWGWIGGSQ
ncbi:hypothetical protein LWI29_022839 [Acer saccharum]|uniref:Acyl-CoA-binding domain-containing protein n=1 Tax=Acer saccharum TaxID=4024 RepID=A0AA39VNP1_ACESA|nr:hypothetical protein LWI29_022839 [Acer saccharum]